jgi:hypothetical protein
MVRWVYRSGVNAFFTLTDLAGLTPDEAIASAVRTAATITRAAFTTAPDYPERTRLTAKAEPVLPPAG